MNYFSAIVDYLQKNNPIAKISILETQLKMVKRELETTRKIFHDRILLLEILIEDTRAKQMNQVRIYPSPKK
jgi:hypothetical protein